MKDSPAKLEGLVRSLNLIPYLHSHREATPMEIARDLGYSHEEVMRDLTRLSMSGVGSGPGELIDLVANWTGITVIDDQGLNKPLRLTPTEANALLLTLESLETMPGLVDQAAVTSAAAKLRAAIKGHSVDDTEPEVGALTSDVHILTDAIARSRQLEIVYYSASSGTTSTRTVSAGLDLPPERADLPARVRGRDHGGEKLPARSHRQRAASRRPLQRAAQSHRLRPERPVRVLHRHRAVLSIRREATWLADYFEIELDSDLGSGDWVRATMAYGNDDWLIRFCLSQGDRVRLVEPGNLARETVRRAQTGVDGLS